MHKRLNKIICSLIFLISVIYNISAQEFTRNVDINLLGGYNGVASWCDYNSDGFLDVFVTGVDLSKNYSHAIFYKNNGDKTFTESNISNIPIVIYGDLSWGDFNNDGATDLLYAGTKSGFSKDNITKVYKSVNGNSFVEVNLSIPQIGNCCVEWVDIDNDGLLDIYYHGINSMEQFELGVYKNMGNENFEKIDVNINKISGSRGNHTTNSVEWADFDNDGFKDVILAMSSSSNFRLDFYKNLGNFTFKKVNIGLPRLNYVSIAVGDINLDGLLDIVFTGSTQQNLYGHDSQADMYIYINQGDLNFFGLNRINNVGVFWNTLELGDVNNDGNLDILYYGARDMKELRLYINEINTFSLIGYKFVSSSSGGASFGDYDNDNDLDILYYGENYFAPDYEVTYVYENLTSTLNSSPQAPDSVSFSIKDNDLSITWNNGSDDDTPSKGLRYNLIIEDTLNHNLALSCNSSNENFSLNSLGNMNVNNSYLHKHLPEGNYTAKIQSIDNANNVSKFSNFSFCVKEDANMLGDTILVCEGDSTLILIEGDFNSYLWSTGLKDSAIYAKEEGKYTVNLVDEKGCLSSENVFVKVNKPGELYIGEDVSIFTRDIFVIDPLYGEGSFKWNNNSTNRNLVISGNQLGIGEHKFWLNATNIFGCTTVDTIIVNVLKWTSINDIMGCSIEVFPIPFEDNINIKVDKNLSDIHIIITDVNGRQVFNNKFKELENLTIPLPGVEKGVYVLHLISQYTKIDRVIKLLK